MITWEDLVPVLSQHVQMGSVTTYAQVSMWGYGVPNLHRPVGSLLKGARNHGHDVLTNRVVPVDGRLVDLPAGREQQRNQLEAEGIPFNRAGNVDFGQIDPVQLPRHE